LVFTDNGVAGPTFLRASKADEGKNAWGPEANEFGTDDRLTEGSAAGSVGSGRIVAVRGTQEGTSASWAKALKFTMEFISAMSSMANGESNEIVSRDDAGEEESEVGKEPSSASQATWLEGGNMGNHANVAEVARGSLAGNEGIAEANEDDMMTTSRQKSRQKSRANEKGK
jgi:hypothetical protein